jgi:hypothetical protein
MARDESKMAAIEMAAERPTGALRGVCTHVRLSPFAWRGQGMPPEYRQRHTSAGPQIFARTAGRYEGGGVLAGHHSHRTLGSNRRLVGTSSSSFAR